MGQPNIFILYYKSAVKLKLVQYDQFDKAVQLSVANISPITLNTSSLTKSINVAIAHGKNKTCFPSWAQISTEQQLKST